MSQPLNDLSRLTVRLVTDPLEVDEWNEFVSRHHYLTSSRMVGEQLRYVAEINGYWVACLGWSAASLKLQDRDQLLGWSITQRRQRLHLVAQNARFLILPGHQRPNLASKCLGLNVRCLSTDWEQSYGHPIWLAETFVEQTRFDGTCYRAAGWKEIGATKGFRRTSAGYRQHGITKRIFLKELIPGAKKRLARNNPLTEDRAIDRIDVGTQPIEGDAEAPSLLSIIRQHVTDPRKKSGSSYSLECLLGIVVAGLLAGCKNCKEVATWAQQLSERDRKRLRCPYKWDRGYTVPAANTLRYLLQDMEPGDLESVTRIWAETCGINMNNTHIAIDGKVLRGSITPDAPAKAQLNAYHVGEQVPLDQQAVAHKSNEIPAARELLSHHSLSGTLITADAAHTNHDTATHIAEKGGSICSPSKGINLTFTTPPKMHSQPQGSRRSTMTRAADTDAPNGEPSPH
jgi:hypothetical protein